MNMGRKKLSEMTLFERVSHVLKDATTDEAEDVAIQILSSIVARHVYVRGENEEYVMSLVRRICEAGDEWAQQHSFQIAVAKVGVNHKELLEASESIGKAINIPLYE